MAEVQAMLKAAKDSGRHGHRDALLILMMYRHALRVSELVNLQWRQMDLPNKILRVERLKNGAASEHLLEGDEIRALRKLQRDYPANQFVFVSERRGQLSINAVHKIIVRAGQTADLELSVHPQMLRHSKGFELASKGADTRAIQAYFGHRNIQHTAKYTQVNSNSFQGFGKDLKF